MLPVYYILQEQTLNFTFTNNFFETPSDAEVGDTGTSHTFVLSTVFA